MNIKFILKILKLIYLLFLPILAIFCLRMYWESELIVDKIHYGIFMLVMLILMLDSDYRRNNKDEEN
jgi:hypothetical protein